MPFTDTELEALPPIMRANDVARLLTVTPNRLAKMRGAGDSPPFIQAGRSILYTRAAVAEWLAQNTRQSTSGGIAV